MDLDSPTPANTDDPLLLKGSPLVVQRQRSLGAGQLSTSVQSHGNHAECGDSERQAQEAGAPSSRSPPYISPRGVRIDAGILGSLKSPRLREKGEEGPMPWSLNILRADEAVDADGRIAPARWQRHGSLKRLVEDHQLVKQSGFVRQDQTPADSPKMSPESANLRTPSPSICAVRAWKAPPPLMTHFHSERSSHPASTPRHSPDIHAIDDPRDSLSLMLEEARPRLPMQTKAEMRLLGTSEIKIGPAPLIDAPLVPVSCLGVWEVSSVTDQSMLAICYISGRPFLPETELPTPP